MSNTQAKVLFGNDNWLFLTNDSNNVIDQISGKFKTAAGLDEDWKRLFRFRQAASQRYDFQYQFTVAPNKECVYSDKLPAEVEFSTIRPIDKVLQAAEAVGVSSCYPLTELIAARETCETFPQGDTHWNGWGAFIAFNAMAANAGINIISQDEVIIAERAIDGDLSSKIGKNTEGSYISVRKPSHKMVYNNKISNIGNLMIFENTDQSLPTAIFFRDSFATFLLPLIAMSFRRVFVVWQPNLDYELIDRERPDFVFSQQAERFLIRCPIDVNGKTNEQYVMEKMAQSNQ